VFDKKFFMATLSYINMDVKHGLVGESLGFDLYLKYRLRSVFKSGEKLYLLFLLVVELS
jgi:hypothetical protein